MKKINQLLGALAYIFILAGCASNNTTNDSIAVHNIDPLYELISKFDTAAFDAFNNCSDPEQLKKHANYFSPEVEFYHDNGGVTWSRKDMIANTEKYVCGNFSRELIPGSLSVFPIKDFGAISLGSHQFCQFNSDNCEGLADFTMVWRNNNNKWEVTRVLSYGHRPNK